MNLRERLTKIGLPLTLALGLTALVLIENGPGPQMENGRLVVHQKNAWRRLIQVPGKQAVEKSNPLLDVMKGDELAGQSPYNGLSEDAAFLEAMKNIKAFERTTLRSAAYRDEAGYDLVHYEILHQDGSMSQILAHVDYDQTLETSSTPQVKVESVVVLILNPVADEQYQLTQFKNGIPVEGLNLPRSRGETRIAQKLDQAIPFLSVSR